MITGMPESGWRSFRWKLTPSSDLTFQKDGMSFSGPSRSLIHHASKPPVQTTRPRKDPHFAEVKFEIRMNGQVDRKDGQFAISQPLADLYSYLEQEVFDMVDGLEIFQPYPRQLIPRAYEKALASMKIEGTVLLHVTCRSGRFRF
jgi:hypothetical protein